MGPSSEARLALAHLSLNDNRDGQGSSIAFKGRTVVNGIVVSVGITVASVEMGMVGEVGMEVDTSAQAGSHATIIKVIKAFFIFHSPVSSIESRY